jgi:hypothetical protein
VIPYIEFILAPILFTYSIFLTIKWKKSTRAKKIFIVLSIGLSFLIAFNAIKKYNKEQYIEKVQEKFGDIVNGNKTEIPKLRIGNVYYNFTFVYNLSKNGVFFNDKNPIMKIYAKDNKVYINAILSDYKRNIIAVISDNTWKIFDDNYEYNNDDNAFEIVTKGDRKVFMHVEFKNGYAYIQGFFMAEKTGVYIALDDNNDPFMNVIYGAKNKRNDDQARDIYLLNMLDNKIKPIFKYPREKYLGIRNLD